MRKLLIILSLLLLACEKEGLTQTIWYVSNSGSDVTGDGTSGNPWATIYKATSTIPSIDGAAGDIIHVNAGTYYINNQISLEGVTLEGAGYTTHVISQLNSETWSIDVTNTGSTIHIRNIRFDGNSTNARYGVQVYNTNNVWIHDCFFENFLRSAANFEGTTYRTGNRFYNNTVTNCSGGTASGYGDESYAVKIDRQTSFVFSGNTCNETIRTIGYSGVAVGGLAGTNGLQFTNNNISANFHNDTYWTFGVEFWYGTNPTMTGNTFNCEIDWGGFGCTGLTFSGNTVGPTSPVGRTAAGLQIEQYCEDILIEKNVFRYLDNPVYFCWAWPSNKTNYGDNITIRSNLIYGVTGYSTGWGIRFESGSNDQLGGLDCLPPTYVDGLYIYNNTIVAYSSNPGDYGILLPSQGRTSGVTNVSVRNNIIVGFSSRAIYAYQQDNQYSQSISILNITYNDYYSNGSDAAYFSGFTPSNYTSLTGIITTNPLFVSSTDFHLQTGSGAIHTGQYISAFTDITGLSFLNPPSMGAYEYTSGASVPTLTTTAITDVLGTTATSGGYISSDGGAAVSARGVCWSTSANPTTADDHTTDGTGTGSFISYITGLTNGVTYHVRAYATNSVGTAYGSDRQFTTGTNPATGVQLYEHNGILLIHNGKFLKP